MLVEQVADELADPAVTDHDHAFFVVGGRQRSRRRLARHLLGDTPGGAAREQRHERQGAHGQGHHRQHPGGDTRLDEAELGGEADADEGEFAARRQQQAGFDAGRPWHPEEATER